MTQLPFATYDVFTDAAFAGNPLAIVMEADGLSTAQMQCMAREFNLSETIFVRPPANPAHTAEVRIFFPTAEIPFAGHPTIGCAIHLARAALGDGDWDTDITLEEQAGLVPVRVSQRSGMAQAEFTAPVIPHAPAAATQHDLASLAADAVGLVARDIGFDHHKVAVWAGGPSFLYIPVKTRSALAQAWPMEPAWSALMGAGGVDSAYLYCQNGASGYTARMFSPTAGIPEDPATGSASAILAAQLQSARVLTESTNTVSLTQGIDMGRPSQIRLTVDTLQEAITEVRIAGGAVPISTGSIRLP